MVRMADVGPLGFEKLDLLDELPILLLLLSEAFLEVGDLVEVVAVGLGSMALGSEFFIVDDQVFDLVLKKVYLAVE